LIEILNWEMAASMVADNVIAAKPWLTLAKKLAIVTGGGSGIGQSVAKQLARAGADVAVLDRNGESARETAVYINSNINAAGLGGRASSYSVDVSKWNEVENAIKTAHEEFQGKSNLAIAVNCAGITRDKFMMKMDEEDWNKVLDINLKGTFFVSKAAAKYM
jgi:NAD(P)-dependent dehydrogenase (short-subunit alcohol dehydrogenase family)